jgi:hypothetical protein
MKNERNIDFRARTPNRSSTVVEMCPRERFPLFQRGLGGFSSTAQFMQADNFIQTPEDYIGYNRYAYCRYNPFKFTDPSGETLMYELDMSSEHGFFGYNPAGETSPNACEEEITYTGWKDGQFTTWIEHPGSSGSGGGENAISQAIKSFFSWIAGIFKKSSATSDAKTGGVSGEVGTKKDGTLDKTFQLGSTYKIPAPLNNAGTYISFTLGSGFFGLDPAKGSNQSFSYNDDRNISENWSIGLGANFDDGDLGISITNLEEKSVFNIGLKDMFNWNGSFDISLGDILNGDGISYQSGVYSSIPINRTATFIGAGLTIYYFSPLLIPGITYIYYNPSSIPILQNAFRW